MSRSGGDATYSKAARLIVESNLGITSRQEVLVIAEDKQVPVELARAVVNAIKGVGAEVTMAVIRERKVSGEEPPRAVAEAMKAVDEVLFLADTWSLGHTNARVDAEAAGARYRHVVGLPPEYLERPLTEDDLVSIAARTERLADLLTKASQAWLTSSTGTDLRLEIGGREAIAGHPKNHTVLDYAEAAISPVEGTAEGMLAIDGEITGWGRPLRRPLTCTVKDGRVEAVKGDPDEEKRFRALIEADAGANVIAELGIGTSHTVPGDLRGIKFDVARMGRVHVAVGRNSDIGGNNMSGIHIDGLLINSCLHLDGTRIIEGDSLLI